MASMLFDQILFKDHPYSRPEDGFVETVQKITRDDLVKFQRETYGPRGMVMIDPATRDIVQNEHAMEVYRKPDGKLGERILGTSNAVKDQCKELKVGRCGS